MAVRGSVCEVATPRPNMCTGDFHRPNIRTKIGSETKAGPSSFVRITIPGVCYISKLYRQACDNDTIVLGTL